MVGISSLSLTIHTSQQVCDLLVAIFQTSPFFCFSPKCVFPGNPGSRNDLKKGILAILCHVTFQPGHLSELWTWSGNVCSEAGWSGIRLGFLVPTIVETWQVVFFLGGNKQIGLWRFIYMEVTQVYKGRFSEICLRQVRQAGQSEKFALHISWFLLMAEDLFSSIKSSHWK